MAIEITTWMQNVDYPARIDRGVTELIADEGVLGRSQLTVSERGAGANMSVDIGPGRAAVDGDDESNQGNYLVRSTSTENETVTAAPGSNSRYDLVVLRINDEQAGGAVTNDATFEVIEGTAAASPVAPAAPDSSIVLARIGPITTATASITDAMILDLRPLAGRKAVPGTIEYLAGSKVPTGWLACDGAAVSRTTYADLFAEIGETYGPGDGASTFAVPDLRGRSLFAAGGDVGVAGDDGGAHQVVLTSGNLPAHTHTVSAHTHSTPSHSHTVSAHTHSISHNHGSVNSSSDSHAHDVTRPDGTGGIAQFAQGGGSLVYGVGNYATESSRLETTSDSHSHSVNLPNHVGTSGSGGGGSTGSANGGNTGSSGGGSTGSVGSANPVGILPPHVVAGMAVIRT